ncbi:hypothetical protein QAD02_015457, partial [Eretmocerus hayati]
GVAISCGDCSSNSSSLSLSSSSGIGSSTSGSDITEPGSPCSATSSISSGEDEGLGGLGPSSTPGCKLAPSQQQQTPPGPTRPHQWPWTPPLAATACSNGFKRFKAEPEHGCLPKQAGHPQQTKITIGSNNTKQQQPNSYSKDHQPHQQPQQESQVKITEYFKTHVKPQQSKKKCITHEMSVLVAKTPTEFRRPVTVQRNGKNGLIKGRIDWEARALPHASPSESPPLTPDKSTTMLTEQTNQFKANAHTSKSSLVNENNNITSGKLTGESLTKLILPTTPSASPTKAEDDEEESSRDSAESKQSSISPPSPILTTPTTIRFPVKTPAKDRGQSNDSGFCRWNKCGVNLESSGALLEHLQTAHINTQTGGDNFVCHWQGCKVEGKISCSRRWLERHVLSHGGNKLYLCIVDGCGNRFSSQTALERHVNGHFNQSEGTNSTSRKSTENSGKLVRRNGKKLRYRRQPWSARIFDYFDPGIMEGLQHRLMGLAEIRTQGLLAETPGDAMVLTSQVIARRVELDGKVKVLLRWSPSDIEPDEWVLESEVREKKHVSIRKVANELPEEVKHALYPAISSVKLPLQRVKQRRKPVKNT